MSRWFGFFNKKNAPFTQSGKDAQPGDVRRQESSQNNSEEFNKYLSLAHEDVGSYEVNGNKVPFLLFDPERFANILRWFTESGSMRSSISTDLNILYDGLGNTFVDVRLSFKNNQSESVLLYANKHLRFFEFLAKSGMLAIGTGDDDPVNHNKILTISFRKSAGPKRPLKKLNRLCRYDNISWCSRRDSNPGRELGKLA